VIDAHGGIGAYNLNSEQAMKTREWEGGIGRFQDATDMPDDFRLYHDLVQPDIARKIYPGSPLLIAKMLRENDRLVVNELHPEDHDTLDRAISGYRGVRVSNLDAYECIRANIPPKEKRGLVLIDPPFEKKDEFETLIRQMEEWKKRFPTGIFMLWYPIKAHLAVEDMKGAARLLGLPRAWCVETLLYPRRQAESFNGCGLVIFNAPYLIPERLEAMLPFLSRKMGLTDTPTEWLTPA
jgi:23S rRNA (adenine2030-N6)-methyltransferase